MSRTRSAGRSAYRRLVEAAPDVAVDAIDSRLAAYKAGRSTSRELKAAAAWAHGIRVPSKWYATDGSHAFYFFRKKMTGFDPGWHAFRRQPCTIWGGDAAAAYVRHGGQLTDRKPGGWLSAATLAAVTFGGLDGGPRDWGWSDNEDLDLDIREVERLRAKDPAPFIRGGMGRYAEQFARALAGAR